MKIAVNIYRRPDKNPLYSRLVVGAALGEESGFTHGVPAWGFAERGLVIVCGPQWESAVSGFLAGHRGDRNVTAAQRGNGAVAREGGPHGARARSTPVMTAR